MLDSSAIVRLRGRICVLLNTLSVSICFNGFEASNHLLVCCPYTKPLLSGFGRLSFRDKAIV